MTSLNAVAMMLDSGVEAVSYIIGTSILIEHIHEPILEPLIDKIIQPRSNCIIRTLLAALIDATLLMVHIQLLRQVVENIPSPFTGQTGASVGSFFATWAVMSSARSMKVRFKKLTGMISK